MEMRVKVLMKNLQSDILVIKKLNYLKKDKNAFWSVWPF